MGLGRPEILALGAAMGRPAFSIILLAIGCAGIRMATVLSPPVICSGIISFFQIQGSMVLAKNAPLGL